MHLNIIQPLVWQRWQGFTEHNFGRSGSFGENAHSSWIGWFLGSNFVYICILTLSSHWYEKGDKASPSIILAGQALLVKMLITLELHCIFGSNFVYIYILKFRSHWYAKRLQSFTEHHFGRSSSFNWNAYNSWTACYILFKFWILMYFNNVQSLVCKTVSRLHRALFWPVNLFWWKCSYRVVYCVLTLYTYVL